MRVVVECAFSKSRDHRKFFTSRKKTHPIEIKQTAMYYEQRSSVLCIITRQYRKLELICASSPD